MFYGKVESGESCRGRKRPVSLSNLAEELMMRLEEVRKGPVSECSLAGASGPAAALRFLTNNHKACGQRGIVLESIKN